MEHVLLEKFKVALSPSRKVVFISSNESSLKIMKNVFCFMLKALFVLEIFTFLYRIFGYVEKGRDKKAMVNFNFMKSQTG